jgi:hypothetical protein
MAEINLVSFLLDPVGVLPVFPPFREVTKASHETGADGRAVAGQQLRNYCRENS